MNTLKLLRWSLLCLAVIATSGVRASEIEKFLPKDTDLVMSVNIQQLLDSSLVKKHALELIKTSLAGNKEAQQAMTALGLDPLKDFSRISFGMNVDDPTNPKGVIVVEGKFDTRKIGDVMDMLAKNDEKKFGKDKINGQTVYKFITPDRPTPIFGAAIDSNLMVFATSKELVGAAFDAAKGTRKSEIKKELTSLIDKADAKSSLYLVAYTKGKLDAIPLPDANIKKTVEQVQSLTIDLKVDRDVNLEVAVGVDTADAAKQLQMFLAGILELGKTSAKVQLMQMPELQPLVTLVDSLKSAQKEKAVVITGKLGGDAVDKLFSKDK